MIASFFFKWYSLDLQFVFIRSATANTDLPFLVAVMFVFNFRRTSVCTSVTSCKLDISLFSSQYACCTLSKQKKNSTLNTCHLWSTPILTNISKAHWMLTVNWFCLIYIAYFTTAPEFKRNQALLMITIKWTNFVYYNLHKYVH